MFGDNFFRGSMPLFILNKASSRAVAFNGEDETPVAFAVGHKVNTSTFAFFYG